jgi:hypothetical protein
MNEHESSSDIEIKINSSQVNDNIGISRWKQCPNPYNEIYDFQPTTGHWFFCLNPGFVISKDSKAISKSSVIRSLMFLTEYITVHLQWWKPWSELKTWV